MRREGLLSKQGPRSGTICLSCFFKDRMVIRQLSKGELVHMYQLPFSKDASMSDAFKVMDVVPFAPLASCVIFTSVMRQLWFF